MVILYILTRERERERNSQKEIKNKNKKTDKKKTQNRETLKKKKKLKERKKEKKKSTEKKRFSIRVQRVISSLADEHWLLEVEKTKREKNKRKKDWIIQTLNKQNIPPRSLLLEKQTKAPFPAKGLIHF